jgi:hypothetical protein
MAVSMIQVEDAKSTAISMGIFTDPSHNTGGGIVMHGGVIYGNVYL